uniref:DC1 domain-containing protein n=1 Tax=Leersia perrieri TaxID=77586 RepID=A0A0D9X5Y0_9ORYZ
MADFPRETYHPARGQGCRLKLVEHREGHGPIEFHCDGCKTNGKGTRYVSRDQQQQLALHTDCALAPPTLRHYLVEGEMVLRLQAPPARSNDAIRCNACDRMVEGFHYHGSELTEKGLDMDLHPCCAKLRREIRLGTGGRTITFQLRRESKNKCTFCKKTDVRYYRPWFYQSTNTDMPTVYLHVICIMEINESLDGAGNDEEVLSRLLERAQNITRRNEVVCRILVGLLRLVIKTLMGDPTALVMEGVQILHMLMP